MLSQFSQLHLQEPRWLLAVIPLALVLWLVFRSRPNASAWSNVIDQNLLPYLLQGKVTKVSKLPKWLLMIGGLLAIIALADPVWEKVPRPVFQTNTARVIVLDLSRSMLINDLKPSRLARARFKIEDILSRDEEGQTGLVVFAGDAFTASPLTRDVDTIRNLLPVFTPDIMPIQGSRVDLALQKAHELLKQAGVSHGQVLLIADGASNPDAAYKAAKALRKDGHSVSVLGVGTPEGGLLRLRTKRINVKLDEDVLQKVSKKGGGGYHLITANNADLNTVLKQTVSNAKNNNQQQAKTDDFKSDDWKSNGPYLVLLLLPLAALAFRKGWLLNLLLVSGLLGYMMQPQTVYAADFNDSISEVWQKLWFNREQRADKAFKEKQFQQASKISQTPLRKGSAAYKGDDYQSALNAFKKAQGADARYNEGNALAKLKKYQEAIDAYKKALKLNPDMEDAKANKKALEEFLKKQQKQKQKKKNQKQQNNEQNKKDQKQENKDQQNKEQKNKKKQQGQQKKDQKQGDKGKKDGEKKNQFADANKSLDKKDKKDERQAGQKQDQQKQKQQQNKKKAAKDKQEKDKKNAEKKSAEEQKQADKKSKEEKEALEKAKAKAEELSKEEKMAAEQWLRRIPDDPGGLLRRKFRRQYQRSSRRPDNDEQPW